MANHSLTLYSCLSCQEEYSAHPATNQFALLGHCWACCFVDSIPYSQQDRYFAFIEQEMENEDYRAH